MDPPSWEAGGAPGGASWGDTNRKLRNWGPDLRVAQGYGGGGRVPLCPYPRGAQAQRHACPVVRARQAVFRKRCLVSERRKESISDSPRSSYEEGEAGFADSWAPTCILPTLICRDVPRSGPLHSPGPRLAWLGQLAHHRGGARQEGLNVGPERRGVMAANGTGRDSRCSLRG